MQDEKDISTEHSAEEEDPRVSGSHGKPRWPPSSQATPPERPQAPDGLMDEGLKPRERIKKKKDFLFLYRKGTRVRTRFFNIIYHENGAGFSRLAVVVSRKIGKAVVRNKIKRWVRELFRRNKGLIPFPLDMLVVATRGVEGITWKEYQEEYFQAIRKIKRRESNT